VQSKKEFIHHFKALNQTSMAFLNTIIRGSGSYIPEKILKNSEFLNKDFYDENQKRIDSPGETIVEKFEKITGISERRYANENQVTSDIAAEAAKKAVADAGIDPESIDHIILAHNFGDVQYKTTQSDSVPSLAARVKHLLDIKNPNCVAFDILFGCPGWVQSMLLAHAHINSGMGKRFLLIGSETLSRVIDHNDRDSMIFADGAGAVIVDGIEEEEKRGLLSHAAATHSNEELHYLNFGKSYKPETDDDMKYIKMQGRKIYEYSLTHVPVAMKQAMDKCSCEIDDLKKIIIHQANEKMDAAIVKRFYRLYKRPMPKDIMPMSIKSLGNSSVATMPTLLDLMLKGEYKEHPINKEDLILFASVGAGMNINAFTYKF
jgi:3-oxoacyl-[acyl-carrier-protein] synthase III